MKTLKELNEKAWYRFIKVLYVLLYIPSFLVLFLAYDAGKDYHSPVYPNTIEVALNDPEFYKLSDYDKRNALSAINKDFDNLTYSEQTKVIDSINKRPVPPQGLREKYIYHFYYTRDVGKSIIYVLIALLCYVLFMETIRRTFYYVVIGKLFPRKLDT